MSVLRIRNADVLQCESDSARILAARDIDVDGNRITAVGPSGSEEPPTGAEIIDAGGMLAVPGFVNTHAHVPMTIFRGLAEDVDIETWFNEYMWPLEANLTADDVFWGMKLGLAEMIASGVTAVADHYFQMDRVAAAVGEAGTRAALGWAVFGDQGDEGVRRTASFAEEFSGAAGGRITTWLAPHAPYTCDAAFLEAVAAESDRLGLGIHIHAAETPGQTEASLAAIGRTPIQVLAETGVLDRPTILAHCCGATPDDIDLMAEKPCGVAHAPKTYLKLGMGAAPVLELRRAGVPVGLATDGPVSNNTLDILESMRLMAMVVKHETGDPRRMTVGEVLTVATRESARVFGLPDDLGHLAPGFLADIVLVDLGGAHNQPPHDSAANLVYSVRASDVRTVICDGKILMRDRVLLTLDLEEIKARVGESMTRLSQRVPDSRIQLYRP
ncbi:MAG: amidohydrolase [Thermoanaerobaculales bacterium]|nr:amidohydrolase [Thermoanaerobaculales bacterium]